MKTYKIQIRQSSNIAELLQKFKKTYYGKEGFSKEDLESFYLHIKSTTEDMVERGKKLVDIGSSYQVKQTIENSICNVLIDIDFSPKKPSILSKIKRVVSQR